MFEVLNDENSGLEVALWAGDKIYRFTFVIPLIFTSPTCDLHMVKETRLLFKDL